MGISRGTASTLTTVGSGTTATTTWGTNPAAGSKVIVFVQFNDVPSLLTVTDNGVTPSTFTLDGQDTSSPGIYIYRADGITLPATGSYAVTLTSSGTAGTISIGGRAYTGVQAGGPAVSTTNSGTGTSVSTGSLTPLAAGSLFIGAFGDQTGLGAETITLTGTGYTSQFVQNNGSSYWACGQADAIQAGTSAHNCTWTLGDSVGWIGVQVAYSPSAQITRDRVSTLGQTSSGSTVVTTWGTNPAAGSTVLVFVQCGATPDSVVDNGTTPSTFTLDKATASGVGAYIFRANGITLPSSGSYSVTVTYTAGSATIQAAGVSYLGMKAGPPTVTNSGSGTSTAVSTGAAAPAGPGGLVFGGFSDNSLLNPETITFGGSAPLTQQAVNTNGSGYWCWAMGDGLTDTSRTLTWTLGDSCAWGAVIASYEAAAGGVSLPVAQVSVQAPVPGLTGPTVPLVIPPAFLAAYSPTADWTSTTTPKTQSVTANASDILLVLGGTVSASTKLGTPSDGSNTYALQQKQEVGSACAGYAWTATIGSGPPLTVTTSSLPGASAGTAYSQALAATGGTGTGYTWSISAGTLPAWASLNSSTGVISGSPSGSGTASFTAKVTDSGSNTATRALSITTTSLLLPTWDPTGSAGPYTSLLSDDFNGTSLNPAIWGLGWQGSSGITPPINSGVSPQNNAAYVSVSGGMLNLKVDGSYGGCVTSNTNGTGGTSGFEFTYPAAIEFRANLPQRSGGGVANWCALWTDGQNWPTDGEIDVLESLGPNPPPAAGDWNAYHVHDSTGGGAGTGATHNLTPPYGWHTFGALWTASQVKFYYDGSLVGTVATAGFRGPHYIVMVNTFNTTLDAPTTMQVDWVRVWQT